MLEVHDEECQVGEDFAETECVVELDTVEDPRPIFEAVDVFRPDVTVTITYTTLSNSLFQED